MREAVFMALGLVEKPEEVCDRDIERVLAWYPVTLIPRAKGFYWDREGAWSGLAELEEERRLLSEKLGLTIPTPGTRIG